MNGVKANWHLADMTDSDEDPFATTVYSAGVTIDLTAPEEELAEKMVELMRREESLFNSGLSCDLKWDGQDCRTCPAATLDPEEHRSLLCRLGKDQATVQARFEERRDARLAPMRELVGIVEAAVEIVPPDLMELLTAVGL